MDIKVPQLAEGVENGTVVSVLVKEGERIEKDQTVVELETSKAIAPIPATEGGTVTKVLVKEGDVVPVGRAIISISTNGGAAQSKTAQAAPRAAAKKPASEAVLAPEPVYESQESGGKSEAVYQSKSGFPPPASPSLRKMAEQLGIDLTHVRGSAHGGRITLDDVKRYILRLQQLAAGPKQTPPGSAKLKPAGIDFSKWGPVTKKKTSSLRRTIGERVQASWTTVPHVTQFDDADITKLMSFRKKYDAAYEKKGGRLTVTSFALKAAIAALKKYPVVNASLDEAADELVLKEYFHIGVAVDTEQGLIVPVLRDVDKKSLLDLSIELDKLAEKTRQRKVSMEELQGASFTISNLGSIGGTHFTPIVNKPEVAIMGIGRGVLKPVVANKQSTEIRMMLPVALSYDHRVVDGADGARFIRAFVEALETFQEKDVKI